MPTKKKLARGLTYLLLAANKTIKSNFVSSDLKQLVKLVLKQLLCKEFQTLMGKKYLKQFVLVRHGTNLKR